MTPEDKLKLGIEIISGMKASAYDCSIEDGRIMALEGTEIHNFELMTAEYFASLEEDRKAHIRELAVANKKRLNEQAIFIADIAINKVQEFNL